MSQAELDPKELKMLKLKADAALFCDTEEITLPSAQLLSIVNELTDLRRLFDSQLRYSMAADELWRKAHPDQDEIIPDIGVLLKWLTEQVHERIRTADPVPTPS